MLSFLKREKSKQLEDQLNAAQAQRRTGWENLPEDELFTPAGFSEEQAEATASSNYSYWGSVIQNFLKHKAAVVCLILFLFLVIFSFIALAIGNLVDPPATMINSAGDYVVSYIVSRFVEGKDWLQKQLNNG